MIISFSGNDGVGKCSLVEAARRFLCEKGIECRVNRNVCVASVCRAADDQAAFDPAGAGSVDRWRGFARRPRQTPQPMMPRKAELTRQLEQTQAALARAQQENALLRQKIDLADAEGWDEGERRNNWSKAAFYSPRAELSIKSSTAWDKSTR
jgi:hypothetical protein